MSLIAGVSKPWNAATVAASGRSMSLRMRNPGPGCISADFGLPTIFTSPDIGSTGDHFCLSAIDPPVATPGLRTSGERPQGTITSAAAAPDGAPCAPANEHDESPRQRRQRLDGSQQRQRRLD